MKLPADFPSERIPELTRYLQTMLTPGRVARFREVLRERTRHITLVLEDIFQPHNASAVLRSCDCFGIQDVHIIEHRNRYEVNPDVALGASQWLTLRRYHGTANPAEECLSQLRSKGYRLVATTPHRDGHTPETLPLDSKCALLFGTELEGLTPFSLGMADDYVKIPMSGFTESLNISVSAAIFIRQLTYRLRNSDIRWNLDEDESARVLADWLLQSVRKPELLLRDFLRRTPAS